MPKFVVRGSIGRVFMVTFLFLFFLATSATYLVFRYYGYPQLLNIREDALRESGKIMVEKIEQKLITTRSLSQIVAMSYFVEGSSDSWLKQQIPALFSLPQYRQFVAGGGVWPDSYAFSSHQSRLPLFWGHDKQKQFRFFDDYSKNSFVDYHHEEWYLPVKLMPENSFYWSKVYRDPFSHQTMVTCSTPIMQNDEFYGVATVDISLAELQDIFKGLMNKPDGYVFAVDSFGKVFADPFDKNEKQDFWCVEDLLKIYPFLSPVEKLIKTIHHEQPYDDNQLSLAAQLKTSPEIDEKSANAVAERLVGFSKHQKHATLLKTLVLPNDTILRQSSVAMVFYIPESDWSLIVVRTQDALSPLWFIPSKVAIVFMVMLVLLFVVGFMFLRNKIELPLKELVMQLQHGSKDVDTPAFNLHCSMKNEVGELVYHLNRRGEELNSLHNKVMQTQKSEMIGTLTGKLSHDFNNILHGISGVVSLLQMSFQTSPTILRSDLDEYLENLEQLVNQGNAMMKDLSALSRGESNSFSPIPLNLSEMAAMVVKLYSARTHSSITIDLKTPDYPCMVHADPVFLETTILNFCINAEHAMTIMRANKSTWGGKMRISTFKVPLTDAFVRAQPHMQGKRYIALSVQDDGVGMTPEIIARIFDPFFTSKPKGQGSGLGLALVQSGIQRHGGELKVVSKVGVGSTFTIYLPEIS